MSDRIRFSGTDTPRTPANGEVGGPELQGPSTNFADLLSSVLQQVSRGLAGPNFSPLPPLGATDAEAEQFIPEGPRSLDPDEQDLGEDTEEFTPEFEFDLPEAVDVPGQAPGAPGEVEERTPFDVSDLSMGGDGNFVRTSKGLIRFTRGVGEAPSNKANWQDPAYVARADFMAGVLDFALEAFDAASAGHYRDHNAEVTPNRSSNSDHYSGGAIDLRASTVEEAHRILAWASQQPWVSFAQVYPDSTLVHISANIAAFGGSTGPRTITPTSQTAPNEPNPQREQFESGTGQTSQPQPTTVKRSGPGGLGPI